MKGTSLAFFLVVFRGACSFMISVSNVCTGYIMICIVSKHIAYLIGIYVFIAQILIATKILSYVRRLP